MALFDSHCHLTDRAYLASLDEVVQRAQDNEVKYLLTAGLNIDDSLAAIKIADKYPGVYCSVGIHPHDAKGMHNDDMDKLEQMSANPKVQAIGETGLDYFRNYSDRESQEIAFHNQINLAQKLGLPMIIHIRAAYPEAKAILLEHKYYTGVLHCYSGDELFAQWAVAQGFYISFSGSITYDNPQLKQIAKKIPEDRILIETDAPYLPPVPMRGKRNEPAYVKYTAQTVAQLRNCPFEHLAHITTRNTKTLFRI
ncbi:MAG: TatD family hydrolase [Candidatus Latescibacteria bacterium]|nr:TatD family hydrolase [Candidatus Latescibacterota bacterium]